MTFAQLGLAALLVYLALLTAVAELARRARRDASPADHFLAGRGLGTAVLFLTLYATAYSGNSLLGYPGEAYRRGFSWVMATGFMLAIVVAYQLLVPRLYPLSRSESFVTPGDYLRYRFGEEPGGSSLRLLVAVLMAVALANFLLAQLIAMGLVTSQVTGGIVPYPAGVAGLAALILLYESVGGMRAVAWTDAGQGVLMLAGLTALLLWLVRDAGGAGAITDAIAAVRPDAVAVPPRREQVNWASTLVLLGVASVVYPQAIQRVFAARSARALRRSLSLMSFMPLATTLVVTLIGLAAIPRFDALGGVAADTVTPRLLHAWAAEGPGSAALAVLVFLGALAAIMSTADSVLLSLGSVLAQDLLGGERRDPRTTARGKALAAVSIAGATALALAPRLSLWRLIELKMELLIQCAPAFLVGLHWRGLRARPAAAGVLAGTAVAVAGVLGGIVRPVGVHVGVWGLAINLAVACAGSALEGRLAPGANGRGRARPAPTPPVG